MIDQFTKANPEVEVAIVYWLNGEGILNQVYGDKLQENVMESFRKGDGRKSRELRGTLCPQEKEGHPWWIVVQVII